MTFLLFSSADQTSAGLAGSGGSGGGGDSDSGEAVFGGLTGDGRPSASDGDR